MSTQVELTFSQRNGYESLPKRLGLEEIPDIARKRLWNVVYRYTLRQMDEWGRWCDLERWKEIFEHLSLEHYGLTLEESDRDDIHTQISRCKESLETEPFHKVLDLVERIMRHSRCPDRFRRDVAHVFSQSSLAYSVVQDATPTIVPALSEVERHTIAGGLHDMEYAKQSGARAHILRAAECIKKGDWAASVRESIHAVESACQGLTQRDLDGAWKYLEREESVHPALVSAFKKLYGYASNEKGVRHALAQDGEVSVQREEAAFMLSACAAFCSYLWHKVQLPASPDAREEEGRKLDESTESLAQVDLDTAPF